MNFISKFNPSRTNRGCMYSAISKGYTPLRKKRAHKAQDMQFLHQNVQNEIFKILEIFKNNIKFIRAAC